HRPVSEWSPKPQFSAKLLVRQGIEAQDPAFLSVASYADEQVFRTASSRGQVAVDRFCFSDSLQLFLARFRCLPSSLGHLGGLVR
ncbi:MAG: hypothetical protein ACOC6F_02695, partial [bacterium]